MSAELIALAHKFGAVFTETDRVVFSSRSDFEAFAAALSTQARASEAEDAPEGWQLVPVEPTYAMLRAYATCWQGFKMRGTELGTRARHEWKAMLDAAPRATQGDGRGENGE